MLLAFYCLLCFRSVSAAESSGNFQFYLDSLLAKAASPSPQIEKFIIDVLVKFRKESLFNDFVVIVGDDEFDQIEHHHPPGGVCYGWATNFLEMVSARVFFGYHNLPPILKDIPWSYRTFFIVLVKKDYSNDFMYVDENQSYDLEMIDRFREDHYSCDETCLMTKEEILDVLYDFWSERIVNVLVAYPKKTKTYIYSYFPYSATNCDQHLSPVLINIWFSSTSTFYRDREFFPPKADNLFGCSLNVSVVIEPPANLPIRGGLSGIEGTILMNLFDSMNATPNFRFVTAEKSETAMNNVLSDIQTGVSELGAGFLIPIDYGVDTIDEIYLPVNLCLTWAVPSRAKIKNYVAYIFETFSTSVWIFVILSIAFSSLVFWLLRYPITTDSDSLRTSTILILLAFFGVPVRTPTQGQLKVFLSLFMFFSVLIINIFQAGLGSNKIIIPHLQQLETLEDVIKRGLKVKGIDPAFSKMAAKLKKKKLAVEFAPIEETLREVGLQRKTVYIGYKITIEYYEKFRLPELRSLIYIRRSCFVNYQPFLALRKNSPYTSRVSQIVSALTENGLIEWVLKNFTKHHNEGKKNKRNTDFDMVLLYGGLEIWFYGMTVSLFVFIVELIVAKLQILKNKKINSQLNAVNSNNFYSRDSLKYKPKTHLFRLFHKTK